MLMGTKIKTSHILIRKRGERNKRFWSPVPCAETEVMVIGQRTLSNGAVGAEEDYGGAYFIGEEYFQAYLVVADMRSKPFYIYKDFPNA